MDIKNLAEIKKEMYEKQNSAWKLLEEKGFSMGEKIAIRSAFALTYMNEYPFITIERSGEKVIFRSDLDQIKFLIFETIEEVNLANALVIMLGDKFDANEFIRELKHVLRILQIESNWSK